MILSIGEILADMIGKTARGTTNFEMFCGGAPFNVAVNCKKAGAKTGFICRVGQDLIGRFLLDTAARAGLDALDIQIDRQRNTTLAFVSLADGERDFNFFRHDTADYHIQAESIDLAAYTDLSILHLGSLMLSEPAGRALAGQLVQKVRAAGKLLSFDVNFRMDLYESLPQAVQAYAPLVEAADILKFSDDEITAYTGESDVERAVKRLEKKNRLLLVTLGSRGSLFSYNGHCRVIPTEKIRPIDTTGAGDAFFGTLLAGLDGQDLNALEIPRLERTIAAANAAGARTTQFYGAIQI